MDSSSPLRHALKITCPNDARLIETELRAYFKVHSLVFIDTDRTLTPFSIIDDQPRVPSQRGAGASETLYVVFIQYPFVLAAVSEEDLEKEQTQGGGKLTLCRLMAVSYGRGCHVALQSDSKRRKLNHAKQLQSLLSLEKIFRDDSLRGDNTKMFESPFTHGESVMSIPQVGADKYLTILQCYHQWFGNTANKLTRLEYELAKLDAKAMSSQELEVLTACLYATWQRTKKVLIEKQL